MKRKTYPLRINPDILDAMQRWANDDLRSLNAQIEYVLRESLQRTGRYKPKPDPEGEQNVKE
ncbi:MAG TPA: Arc family DNA binding domain-containing protein [Gammaproteobacteria bacterium]|nr:Arc family DNA binding domain-containing protein [Gammaproteobacteria bacterium]